MKRIIILCLILTSFKASIGQNVITGHVYTTDNQPLVGAYISSNNKEIQTVTDLHGQFLIDINPTAHQVITISSVGFQTKSISLNDLNSDKLTIILNESITNLPEVLVQSVTMTGGLAYVHKNIGSAHFINQKEIQRFSYSDINRTLRNIPGVNIQEEDGYGLRPNIGLRASGSERSSKITIMEDGILAAPAPYAAPSAYYFPTIGRMEAIEIMKGSSQIKYGPFTTGGAINLISTPIPLKLSGHGDLIAGSDGYKMLHANFGNSYKNVGYMIETFHYGAEGFKQLDNDGATGFKKADYLIKFKVNTNPNADIYQSLQFKIGKASETSNETYLGLTKTDFSITPYRRYAASAQDKMNTSQSQYVLTHHINVTSYLDVVSNIYRNEFSRNWYKLDKVNGQKISNILRSPHNFLNEYGVVSGQIDAKNALRLKANNRSYYGTGVQTHLIFHFTDKAVQHKIDIGLRIHEDQIDRFQWTDNYSIANGIMTLASVGTPGTESNRVETANALAAFVDYKLKWNRITLTPGMRYENIKAERNDYGKVDPERSGIDLSIRKNNTSVVIPGLGINYDWNSSISTFSGVHKGFAPPGSKEGTKPEKSWNYEIGIRIIKPNYRFQILGYFNDYENLLGADLAASGGQGTSDLFNGGAARAMGLEIEGSYNLLPASSNSFKLPISFAYTYTKATFNNDFDSEFDGWGAVQKGYFLPYTPKQQFSISVALEHSKFLFDISTKYNGEMLAQAGQFSDKTFSRTDAYMTTDVSLNYRWTRQITAFFNVNNVTNEIYVASLRPAGLRPGLPRSYNLGFKFNL
ncbi:MAG: TonB-dependent receptor [Saprospiraceae bacterium]